MEIFVRPIRYKGCHQAHNAQVVICAFFTTPNSLKLQERRKAFYPYAKFVPYRKSCAHNQARQLSDPFSCAASYVPPSRFPPLEVCVRRPRCAPRHRHGAGIRKPSHNRTHAPLVWALVESVYFDFAGLSLGLIVLPLSSRVSGREISRSSFKLSDCALGESRIAVQIVGIQGLDHARRCASCCLWSSSDILLVVTDTAS